MSIPWDFTVRCTMWRHTPEDAGSPGRLAAIWPPRSHPANGGTRSRNPCARTGGLVLFPSYFWHGTRPFALGSHRTTVAFDIAPRVLPRTPSARPHRRKGEGHFLRLRQQLIELVAGAMQE